MQFLKSLPQKKKFRSIVSNRKSRSCSSQVVVQKNQLTNEPFGIHNRHWIAKQGSQENIKALHCQFQIPFKYEPPYFDLYKKDSHIYVIWILQGVSIQLEIYQSSKFNDPWCFTTINKINWLLFLAITFFRVFYEKRILVC